MSGKKAECPNCGSFDLDEKFSTYAVKAGSGWRGEQWAGKGCGAGGGT